MRKFYHPGDYLIDYDPDIWGDAVTFEELQRLVGTLVIVNDTWYPDDVPETDAEGEIMRVLSADDTCVRLDDGTPKGFTIRREQMDMISSAKPFTAVWRLKESEEPMNEIPNEAPKTTLSIESPCFEALHSDLDAMLQKTITSMLRKDSDEAAITLKISLQLEHLADSLQRAVIRPEIEHKITSAITVKEDTKGRLQGDYELVYDDATAQYTMRELAPLDGQMRLV